MLMTGLTISPEFWRMIEESRQQRTIPLDEIRSELLADEQ
jgi:hypothetical protein